jgi:hypothetical protein
VRDGAPFAPALSFDLARRILAGRAVAQEKFVRGGNAYRAATGRGAVCGPNSFGRRVAATLCE